MSEDLSAKLNDKNNPDISGTAPMTGDEPKRHSDADALAETIIREVGKTIVLALPLGLGKANHVANALFARAAADPSIRLKIFTALTLERPRPGSDMERRFMGPVIERLFGGYPDLDYAKAMREGRLPANVEVNEFFLLAGRWLGSPQAQQNYISANYTHALRYILDRGVNVVAQLVAARGQRFNLSCNTDITLDLLKARADGKARFLFVGEVNNELPYMPGEAELSSSAFAHILDGPGFPLFAPPKEPVGFTDHAIGLHVAGLVPDGGTLQIGIGSMGDAVAHGLILRHRENAAYRSALSRLSRTANTDFRNESPFDIGLYGASEMLVDSFLDLMKAGVLKREVDDGIVLHAGFFLGPQAFYKALREMPAQDLARIRMSAISFVNDLHGDEERKRRARLGARFVNSAMMTTLLGAVVSDGLEDGRVVSGVGGQYNFVAQAFALDDARSVITLRSTRENGGKTLSNIRWNYGHTTIPRHLRDIVVTEYGVADLRGKTDRDTIVAMLGVTDARFQNALLTEARKAGKIEKTFEIPAAFRENTPERIGNALKPLHEAGLIPSFPFGTDLTEAEQRLMPVLQGLKTATTSPLQLIALLARGVTSPTLAEKDQACLSRMALDRPKGLKQRLYAALLRGALSQTEPR